MLGWLPVESLHDLILAKHSFQGPFRAILIVQNQSWIHVHLPGF